MTAWPTCFEGTWRKRSRRRWRPVRRAARGGKHGANGAPGSDKGERPLFPIPFVGLAGRTIACRVRARLVAGSHMG